MSVDYIVTVKEVYTTGYEVPRGWELTGEFRPPKEGEKWLSLRGVNNGFVANQVSTAPCPWLDYVYDPRPRLILRKANTRVVTFRSTGDVRVPKDGEWYQPGPGGQIWKASGEHLMGSYPIFTRTETEE